MGVYFKPLRRKFGLVTLLLVCLFIGMWARSHKVSDYLRVSVPFGGWAITLNSYLGQLEVSLLNSNKPSWRAEFQTSVISSRATPLDGSIWFFRVEDFFAGTFDGLQTVVKGYVVLLNYYVIGIPLAMLSAWLLLSKPRKRETALLPPT